MADCTAALRLVKMEPGAVNRSGAEAERGDLRPLTFTGKLYAAQIHGAFFLSGMCPCMLWCRCSQRYCWGVSALPTESPPFRTHLAPCVSLKVGINLRAFPCFHNCYMGAEPSVFVCSLFSFTSGFPLSLPPYIYTHTYIYPYVCIYVYICIYMYIIHKQQVLDDWKKACDQLACAWI